jgi:two-component system cell cycle response regulator DivK
MAQRRQPTVLVVEDEQENLAVLCDILREIVGALPLAASSAAQGLQLARQHLPDLILMDLLLPDMEGLEAVARLKQDPTTAHIPVIAVSALVIRTDRDQALAAGCVDYIGKPFDLDELAGTIRRYLSPAGSNPRASGAGGSGGPA